MTRAVWKDTVLAQSEDTILVEGNHYFPPADIKKEYLVESDHKTTCPWKGLAHYYHLQVAGEKNENAVWAYLDPKEKARHLTGYFAFGKDVKVE